MILWPMKYCLCSHLMSLSHVQQFGKKIMVENVADLRSDLIGCFLCLMCVHWFDVCPTIG